MKGKVCLVTGASSGLGKAIASALARRGATVVLACRDQARGEAARADIISATGGLDVDLVLVDLSQQSSVRHAADIVIAKYERLDVLVNNAAVYVPRRTTTPEGLETMFATNHLGPFLLTNLLLDRLKASAPARILVITAPSTTQLNFDDLQSEQRFSPLWAFGATKMANLLFTYELARRLEGTGVTGNAVHPGIVKTNLMRGAPLPIRWLSRLGAMPPEKAAVAIADLAASRDVDAVTGKFFKGMQVIESSPYSHNQDVQHRLWDVSAALTHLA
jgi:NAD(P)-dependent dehydrogenase (short-subunit alcohol dehydrogenase family)